MLILTPIQPIQIVLDLSLRALPVNINVSLVCNFLFLEYYLINYICIGNLRKFITSTC